MKALGWWLMLVGSLRLASVWFGFFNIRSLHRGVYSKSQVTEVHARTFGIWTLLTCTLCYLCALTLKTRPSTSLPFCHSRMPFVHFLTEYLIYGTTTVRNLSAVSFFAGTSIIWMLLQWNSHQPQGTWKAE